MKTDRLLAITLMLLTRKRVSAKELAEMFGVSVRTIYRDMASVSHAGVPFASLSGEGGGYSLMPGYAVDTRLFSDTDFAILLSALEGAATLLQDASTRNALARLLSQLPAANDERIRQDARAIRLDFSPWRGEAPRHEHVSLIRSAVENRQRLAFDYMNRHGETSSRIVEPHALVFKERDWYMQAFCPQKQDFRLFKLSRISRPEPLEETFQERPLPSGDQSFSRDMAARQCPVQLRFPAKLKDVVGEYCPQQTMFDEKNGFWRAELPFIDDEYGYRMLMGFGPECQCLGPEHIRQKLMDQYARALSSYQPR